MNDSFSSKNEEKKFNKNILALISMILTGLYLIYSLFYWSGIIGNTGSDFSFYLGGVVATALITPHLLCILIGFIFNCIGFFINKKSFILVAAILYAVSILLFLPYFMFIVVQMVLCFIAYATFDSKKQKSEVFQTTLTSTQSEIKDNSEIISTTKTKSNIFEKLTTNKVALFSSISILIVVVIVAGSFFNVKQKEKLALKHLNNNEFSESLKIYEKLSKNNPDSKYKNNISNVKSLIADQKNCDEAIKYISNKDTYNSILYLNKIDNKEKFKDEINDSIAKIINLITEEISLSSVNQNYTDLITSLTLLENEAKSYPELYQYISTTKNSLNSISKANEYNSSLDETIKSLSQSPKNIYPELIGTYNYVTSSNANVRSGPGFDYPIIYNLSKGDSVYVVDTKYADERIWCNISDGWLSINTINGAIK